MAYNRTPLHDIVDPLRTLPEVEFIDTENLGGRPHPFRGRVGFGMALSNLVIISPDEELLVGATTTLDEYDNALMFKRVNLSDGVEIGKGFGLQMYLYAIHYAHEQGLPFRSSSDFFSSNAKKVWEKLIQLGVAVIERDGFAPNYCDDEWTADIFVRPAVSKGAQK